MQNKKDDDRHVVAFGATAMTFSGPLPPADEFRKYNEAHPGTAERMLSMVERQSAHRIENETELVAMKVRGQWLNFIITMLALTATCLIAYFGDPIVAAVPGIFGVASIVSMFRTKAS
jgi:uncharacterized membrane protein